MINYGYISSKTGIKLALHQCRFPDFPQFSYVFMSFHVLQLLSHILTVLQDHPIQLCIRLGPRQPIRFPK